MAIACLCLAACGGSSGGDTVVAQVAGTQITRASVNHWMNTLAGGDYYELSGRHTVPAGLVSDPPNYSRCVSQLKAAAAAAPKKIVNLSSLEMLDKCRQLQQALKLQATAYLVEAHWLIGLAGELGLKASDSEVVKLFRRVKSEEFPTEAAQRQFLTSHRLTLADELFVLKLDVLKTLESHKIETEGRKALTAITAAGQRWDTRTTCHAGYVVVHCRGYKGGEQQSYPTPSPAVLMEQVAAVAIGRCTNFAACLKQ